MKLVRFTVGRFLVHAGLRLMPHGRARAELFVLFNHWGKMVMKEIN